jgi:signal transduction histidine kinase
MLAKQPYSLGRDDETQDRAARGVLYFVDEFGGATQSFFERLYRGLSRKRASEKGHTPLPDPDNLSALRQANRELTARVHEAETSAARLQAVFARIDEGVIMQSPEGRIVLMNDAAYRLLGSIKAFWESDLGRMFKRAHERANGGPEMEPVGDPIRVQINDRILGAQLAAVSGTRGSALGTLIVLRDVTREALADRLKDQFITQISHELRTPLTAIKGMSEVILSQPEGKPPNRKFLEAIARNAAVLDRMIIELLDLSEISAGSFSIRREAVLLDELVLTALRGREAQINKAGLRMGLLLSGHRERPEVRGDERRLAWAVGHLLDNAIHYTQSGGLITIRIGQRKHEHLLMDVIDTGVGISERDMAHVFERFYRGEARTREGKTIDPRGLGQGLFIARAVAEAHGGYLIANSTPGYGSKFTLGLPLTPAITN